MSNITQELFARTDHYISGLLAGEDEALQQCLKSLEEAGIGNASISPVQGKLLQVLASACHARKILELGTLAAYSSIWLARALPADGKLISIEFDPAHAALAEKNIARAGLSALVEIRQGKALDILPRLEQEKVAPFDLVFIDADKGPYVEYFQWALRLCRSGSIIVADNIIRNGKVLDPASMDEKVQGVQRFNKMLSTCQEVNATILQTVGTKEYDGMAIAVVK